MIYGTADSTFILMFRVFFSPAIFYFGATITQSRIEILKHTKEHEQFLK